MASPSEVKEDVPDSSIQLQDASNVRVSFRIKEIEPAPKGLFSKKPPAWWPDKKCNAELSHIDIASAHQTGDFGRLEVRVENPMRKKPPPGTKAESLPEYQSHYYRLRIDPDDLDRVKRQFEKGVGAGTGVGTGAGGLWAGSPQAKLIEVEEGKLIIRLVPANKVD